MKIFNCLCKCRCNSMCIMCYVISQLNRVSFLYARFLIWSRHFFKILQNIIYKCAEFVRIKANIANDRNVKMRKCDYESFTCLSKKRKKKRKHIKYEPSMVKAESNFDESKSTRQIEYRLNFGKENQRIDTYFQVLRQSVIFTSAACLVMNTKSALLN